MRWERSSRSDGKEVAEYGVMQNLPTCLALLAFGLGGYVRAGDVVAPRQKFTETVSYPHIFKAAGYLASRGPLPMRFAASAPPCEQRRPPAAPLIASKEPVMESSPAQVTPPFEPIAASAAPTGIATESSSKPVQPDFSKVPDEVLDFFKNTEGRPVRRAYLFDPIFQPVTPDDLPKSKATSVQK